MIDSVGKKMPHKIHEMIAAGECNFECLVAVFTKHEITPGVGQKT
jgi:hypothetical protein